MFAPGTPTGGPAPGACAGSDADPRAYDRLHTACVGPLDDAALAKRGRAVAVPALPGGAAVVEVWVPPGEGGGADPTLVVDFVAPALDGDPAAAACAKAADGTPHFRRRRRRLAEEGKAPPPPPPPLPGDLSAGGLAPADVFLPPDDAGGLLPSPVGGAGGGGGGAGAVDGPVSLQDKHAGTKAPKGKKGGEAAVEQQRHDRSAAAAVAASITDPTAPGNTHGQPTLHTSYAFAPFQMRYDAYTSTCTPAAACYSGPAGGSSPFGEEGAGANGGLLTADGATLHLGNVSRAAVSIYAVDRSLKTFSLCSGALIRLGGRPSGAGRRAPLLLTADHCLG